MKPFVDYNILPFKVQISRGVEVSASLEFFTNAHADCDLYFLDDESNIVAVEIDFGVVGVGVEEEGKVRVIL